MVVDQLMGSYHGRNDGKRNHRLRQRAGPVAQRAIGQADRLPSNGFIERFHQTLPDEHVSVEGRTTWYESVEEMQAGSGRLSQDLQRDRPHHGRGMEGRTPYEVFKARIPRKRSTRKPSASKEVKTAA